MLTSALLRCTVPLLTGAAWLLSAATSPGVAGGGCLNQRVTIIDASAEEAEEICAALVDVVRYFLAMGLPVDPSVEVLVRSRRPDEERPQMHGYFDAALGTVVVIRAGPAPWSLEWSPAIRASYLRHEFVHVATHRILRTDHTKLRREWHEFIAYAVQIALMEPSLRDRILAAHPDAAAAADLSEINEFIYGFNPDRFAITAYRTYVAHGGPVFVEKLLRLQIIPPPISYPFPVLPADGVR